MSDLEPIGRALAALDRCQTALDELDAECCAPGRSPRMLALGDTLASARSDVEGTGLNPGVASKAIVKLEDAGAQVGRLQVTCCAPGRMKLYADFLAGLTKAQINLSRSVGSDH